VSTLARRSCCTRIVPLTAALLLSLSVVTPAAASPETIKRAGTNLLFAPTDFALSPIVAMRGVYNNLQDIDDTTAVRVVYFIPGVAWNTAFIAGGGLFRTFTGMFELIPGIFLIPFEADMDPMFAPPERADALIDEEFDALNVKIGINYVD
jgi:hypothetical protein